MIVIIIDKDNIFFTRNNDPINLVGKVDCFVVIQCSSQVTNGAVHVNANEKKCGVMNFEISCWHREINTTDVLMLWIVIAGFCIHCDGQQKLCKYFSQRHSYDPVVTSYP